MNKYVKRGVLVGGIWGLISLLLNTGLGTGGRYQPGLVENIIFLPVGILNILRPPFSVPVLIIAAIIIGISIGLTAGYIYGKIKK
jgi:hypothetical protein